MAKKSEYKVKVTLGDSVVEIEGDEKGVVSIVRTLSEVLRSSVKRTEQRDSTPRPSFQESSTRGIRAPDIRAFFKHKTPTSDIEAAALVAYYYKYMAEEREGRDAIDTETLNEAFRLAGRKLSRNPKGTLWNARRAGYLDGVGDGGYALNPVGYNLVEHTLGKTSSPESKPRRSKKSRRTRKRK